MIKIIGVAFVGIICYKLIKNVKSDFAPLILVAVGAIILILVSDKISQILNVFDGLSKKAGLSGTIFSSLLKIIGIGYVTEYAAEVCDDCDCSSIGKKIELAGKITIFVMSLPIINGIVETIGELL